MDSKNAEQRGKRIARISRSSLRFQYSENQPPVGRYIDGYVRYWFLVPLSLWLGMWLNLNTGFWNITNPTTLNEWQLLIRAGIPYVSLPLGLVLLCISQDKLPVMKASPNGFLLFYGCIAAFATVFSPQPEFSYYWSLNFLAAILCTWLMVKQEASWLSARQLLEATWVICFVAAVMLSYQGRNSLFGGSPGSEGAYGINVELQDLSRSSGVGRWAAIPALVFLLRAFVSNGAKAKIAYFGAALFCSYVVYRVQSRGAVFGVLGAILLAFLASRKFQGRFAVLLISVLLAASIYGSVAPDSNPENLGKSFNRYVHRGQSEEEFRSMTGRTRAYRHGLAAFWDSPLLGMGQWTDRLHPEIGEHIHNSFLQSLLNGGIVGFVSYICSWIAGWFLFFQLWMKRYLLAQIDQRLLLEAGMVMAFFTLRAIPETTTASFSVDLMVMVAVYCYMEALGCTVLKPATARKVSLGSKPKQVRGVI
jgi:O-antigen ligase